MFLTGAWMGLNAPTTFAAEPAPSAAALAKGLASKDVEARRTAARSLWRLGPASAPAIAALVKALGDPDPMVRAYAARAVGASDTTDRAALTALTKLLFDKDQRVNSSAAEALDDLLPDPAIVGESALKALSQHDVDLVEPLIATLVAGGERSVPLMIEALKNKENAYWAALVLAELGPTSAPAIPALVQTLQDKRPEVQLQALVALGQIGPKAASSVPAISKFLDPKSPAGLQYAAAFALANIGDKSALAELKTLQDSQNEFLRTIAAWGVARIDPSPEAVKNSVTVLIASLQSKDSRVRQSAARGLAELKPDPELVREKIAAALADGDPTVRANVADAIASLGVDIVPRMAEALKDERTRQLALESLRELGDTADDARPAVADLVIELHKAGDEATLPEALMTLGAIGEPPAELRGLLIELTDHHDPMVQRGAIYVLGKMGPSAVEALPKLMAAAKSSDEQNRIVGTWALLQVAPDDPETMKMALPLLIGALKSERELVRLEAALALGRLGAKAKSSVPALEALQGDPDADVRVAAQEAIKLITGK